MIRVVFVIWICLLTMTTGSAAQGPYVHGYFYTNEEVFVQNKEAYKRFRLAAEKGNADGQYNLGVMYRDGQGVAQDVKEAVKWYRLAANQGNDNAQFDLGAMYDKGQDVAQDVKEAVKWYRLAAKQGNDNAQFNLGIMYRDGKGVPRDFIYSYMWMNIASANGYSFGENYRDTLADEMTQQQIENAQELANKCMSTNYKNCD